MFHDALTKQWIHQIKLAKPPKTKLALNMVEMGYVCQEKPFKYCKSQMCISWYIKS